MGSINENRRFKKANLDFKIVYILIISSESYSYSKSPTYIDLLIKIHSPVYRA